MIHWIDPSVLIPALPLAQEIYACLAATAGAYLKWRPNESQWRSISAGAQDQRQLLISDRHRHSSVARPEDLNALYGHFERFPVHCAAVGASFMHHCPGWTAFVALLLWPYVAPRVLGYEVAVPAQHHVKRLGQLLRDAVNRDVSEDDINLAWERWSALDCSLPTKVPGNFDANGSLWNAISAHVQAYRSTQVNPHERETSAASDSDENVGNDVDLFIDPIRMADPECQGLSPEDADARVFKVGSAGPDDDGSDPLGRVFGNFHAEERDNQHLLLAWNRLAPPELALLRNEFYGFNPSVKCGLALCISLSISPERAAGLEMHESLEAATAATMKDGEWHLAITQDRSVIGVHGVQHAPHAYTREAPSSAGWLESSKISVLGLPSFASDTLIGASQGVSGHVLRFMPEIAESTRLAAEAIRRKTPARLTFGRIREIIPDELFRVTQDECLVARTHPTSSMLCGSGIYYSAFPAITLYNLHRRCAFNSMAWLIPELSSEVRAALNERQVGSELLLDPKALRNAIASLRKRAIARTRLGRYEPAKLVEAFNLQAMYTLAAITVMTNHRPTHEPFPRPDDIQAATNLVLIADKRQFGSNEQRMVPLTANACRQYQNYLVTISATADYLDEDHPAVAASLRSLVTSKPGHPSAALFSLLELKGDQLALRPFERTDWAALWPEWQWPLNGNRHFLMQALNRLGVPREWLSYLFGHAEIGQTAFNRHSTLSPLAYFEMTYPFLAAVERSLRIEPIAPIKGHRRAAVSVVPPAMLHVCLFGDASPKRNRHRRLQPEERSFIRNIVQDFGDPQASIGSLASRLNPSIYARFPDNPLVAGRICKLLSRWDKRRATHDA